MSNHFLVQQLGQLREEVHHALARMQSALMPKRVTEILDRTSAASIESSDLYVVESELLHLVCKQELRLRIAAYRDMLRNLLTRESYTALEAQLLPDLLQADETDLRQEAHYLVARVHRRYAAVPAVESLRARVAQLILGVMALVVALLVGAQLAAYRLGGPDFELAVLAMAAGAFGASVSTIVRLYTLDPRHEPGATWLSIQSGRSTILIAPVLGTIFALVLTLLFRAGLIQGELFPMFAMDDCKTIEPLGKRLMCTFAGVPAEAGAIAKLVVWGFIAGWAERLVPDVLDRLAPQATAATRSA